MKPLTPEDLRRHPGLIDAMHARARRARAEYVHCQVQRLIGKLRPRPTLPLRTAPCG